MIVLGDWRTEISLDVNKNLRAVLPVTILFPKITIGERCDFNLISCDNHVALHIAVSRDSSGDEIVINKHDETGKWDTNEQRFTVELREEALNEIFVDFCEFEQGGARVLISLNGEALSKDMLLVTDREILSVRHSFYNLRYRLGKPRIPYYDWRIPVRSSGCPAKLSLARLESPQLRPGLTALIRAKNEEANVRGCLESIAPLVDEVVFVDNGSTDATLAIAYSLQPKLKNVRIYRYNISVPKVGADHSEAVKSNSTNTLGHYYNWCLSKCRTYNFIKWDCDFIAIEKNFIEMRDEFQLRQREDMISVWCGGLSLYKYDDEFYHETESHYNEFRVHSIKNGAAYVNLPAWEEMDQYYLYCAVKYAYKKPVFVEVFDVDSETLETRGVVLTDARDIKRDEILKAIVSGSRSSHLTKLDNLENGQLATLSLSTRELELADYMLHRYGTLPEQNPAGADAILAERVKQPRLAVMVVTHQGNSARQEAIRRTWKADFQNLGVPVYFLVGGAGVDFEIRKDVLYVCSADWYENLPEKVCKGVKALSELGFDYILKIDDDCVVNAAGICRALWIDMAYAGAHIVHRHHAAFDWHAHKCYNEQLGTHLEYLQRPESWFAGGYGYILGSEGIKAVIGVYDQNAEFLYEDALVGLALEAVGQGATINNKVIRSIHYRHADQEFDRPSGEIFDVIWDVPSSDELVRVHSRLRAMTWAYLAEDTSRANLEWFTAAS